MNLRGECQIQIGSILNELRRSNTPIVFKIRNKVIKILLTFYTFKCKYKHET